MANERTPLHIFGPGMPPPAPDEVTAPFWEACRERRLVVQRCADCGLHRAPPSAVCPKCRGFNFEFDESAGRGRVFTYTIVYHGAHPAVMDAVPYAVAVVRLDDCGGVKLISNVVGCSYDEVRVDMPVELAWDDVSADLSVPRFRPA